MAQCTKCGFINLDRSRFCIKCGEDMVGEMYGYNSVQEYTEEQYVYDNNNQEWYDGNQENNENQYESNQEYYKNDRHGASIKSNRNELDGYGEYYCNQHNNFNEYDHSQYYTDKDKRKKLIGIISVIALLIVAATLIYFFIVKGEKNTPANKIINSSYGLLTEKNIKGSFIYSDNEEKDIFDMDITEDLYTELLFDFNKEQKKISSSNIIYLKNQKLIEMDVAIDTEAIYFDSMDGNDEYVKLIGTKGAPLIGTEMLKLLDYEQYLNIPKSIIKKYRTTLIKLLDAKTIERDETLSLYLTKRDIDEISLELSRIAKEDKKLAKAIYNNLVKVADAMKNDNFESKVVGIMPIIEKLYNLPSEEEFIESFNEYISDLENKVDYYKADKNSESVLEIHFDISSDKLKNIRFKYDDNEKKVFMNLDIAKPFVTRIFDDSSKESKVNFGSNKVYYVIDEIAEKMTNIMLDNYSVREHIAASSDEYIAGRIEETLIRQTTTIISSILDMLAEGKNIR